MGARIHQARMDIGIEGGTSSFKILWTCGEIGTRNGEWCDARGGKLEEKARKVTNKMAGQCWEAIDQSKWRSATVGCRQGSDMTRRHKATKRRIRDRSWEQ